MENPKYAENLVAVGKPPLTELSEPAPPRDLTRKQRRALEARIRACKERKAELDFRGEMLRQELERRVASQS